MVEAQVIATWLTPTSLFVLLNIILATIFLATKNNNSNNNDSNHHDLSHQNDVVAAAPQLLRPPSLFTRVASFNFSNHFYSDVQDPAAVTVTRAPSLLYRVASFNFGRAPQQPQDESESKKENEKEEVVARDDHVRREKVVEEKDQPKKVEQVLKSVKKIGEEKTTSSKGKDEEIEVDAKADDFINKFKQQLKLQRLESLLRYRNNNTPIAVAATT
ncbi:unnamed protein product [Amaranthus hypochondriacus]